MKSSNTFSNENIIGFCFLTFFCIIFLVLPYLNSNLLLPRVEELHYSLYPLIIWAKQLLNGELLMWFSDAGLGVPWPVPHTMSHTPLMLLFGFMPVFQALSIMIAIHVIFQAYFTLRLCSYFNFTPLISAVVLISILLASPIEYLVTSDAPAVFITWTLLPIILYGILKLLESTQLIDCMRYSSLLGFAIGYGILNFHNGVMSTYLIGMSFVVLFQPKNWIPRWHWFLFSALLSLGIGAEKIYILAKELSYFGSNVERLQYDFGQSFYGGFWNFTLKPFVLTKQLFSPAYFDILMQKNSVSRALTFESPLCSLLLIIYVVYFLVYKKNWPKISALQKAMWLTFICCSLAQFTPKSFLTVFISASWNFRDPAILIGILLAGIICNEWVRPRLKKLYFNSLLVIHLFSVIICALIFNYAVNWKNDSQGKSMGLYSKISNDSIKYPLHELIEKALSYTENPSVSKEQTRRVVYDGLSNYGSFGGRLAELGFLVNSLPIHGFQEISFLLKGISTDSIHPSQSKPYGMVSTLSYSKYRYVSDAYDWVQESPALLNLLGIRVVVGQDIERYLENGLVRVGAVNPKTSDPSYRIAVYANPHAFPRAFFVNYQELMNVKHHQRCRQEDNFLTCLDFAPLVKSTNPWLDPVHVEEKNNQISLTFSPSLQTRTLLLSSMWRPEWQVQGAKIESYYGLIKLTIPPTLSTVILKYEPVLFIYARWLTFLCLGIALLFQFLVLMDIVKKKKLLLKYLHAKNLV